MTITINMTRGDLDQLSQSLTMQTFNHGYENVFGIYRPLHGLPYPFLVPLPNRADDPTENFDVWQSDAQKPTEHGLVLLGYVHTHNAREGNEGPSPEDLRLQPPGYIGGVWMTGHHSVYWYETKRVVHQSTILSGEH